MIPASSIRPSYQAGFARSAGESAYPELWRGLVGAWVPALGQTGGTLHDWGAHRNNGTLNNIAAADWNVNNTNNRIAYSITFNHDTTENIRLTGLTAYARLSPHTYTAWINMAAVSGANDFVLNNGDLNDGTSLTIRTVSSANRLGFFSEGGQVVDVGDTVITLNEWHHVATVYGSDNNVTFYLDGVADGVQAASASAWNAVNEDPQIGLWRTDIHPLNGQVASVSIYNRTLTANEVALLYAVPLAPFIKRRRSYAVPLATRAYRRRRSIIQPSYHAGFARDAGESEHPELWRGLVGAWVPALGNTGGTVHDLSAYHSDMSLDSDMDPATDWVIGGYQRAPGYAIDFGSSGASESLELSSDLPQFKILGNITIAAWINFSTSQTNRGIVGKFVGGGDSYLLSIQTVDNLRFTIVVASTQFSALTTNNYNDGLWHLVTARFNGANVLIDVDGGITESIVGDSTTGPIDDGADILTIGNYGSQGLGFVGQILAAFIWNRSISDGENLLLYQTPLAPFRMRDQVGGFTVVDLAVAAAAGNLGKKALIAMLHQRRFPLVP